MTAVIQADNFIETGSCDGPRYNRNAPSRETPGVLMDDIKTKYITEFELPYRNVDRYIKEIGNNWNRLNAKQRSQIKSSLKTMGISDKIETFGNETLSPSPSPSTINNFIQYLSSNPSNVQIFMDTIWLTPVNQASQLGITSDQLNQLQKSMYQWGLDNANVYYNNWQSGVFFGVIAFIILILLIASIATGCSNSGGSSSSPSSSFGKRK